MDAPHPSHHHHHHRLHLHLDPGHHHHIHLHLCHHSTHLLAAAPPTHRQALVPPHSFPNAHPYPTAAPWQPEEPLTHAAAPAGLQREAAKDSEEPALQAGHGEVVYLEGGEEEQEEDEPVFVLTDEWAEFFAKADAKRRLAKQEQKKNRIRKK